MQIKEEKASGQDQLEQENNKLKIKLFLTEQELAKKTNLYELSTKKYLKKYNRNPGVNTSFYTTKEEKEKINQKIKNKIEVKAKIQKKIIVIIIVL